MDSYTSLSDTQVRQSLLKEMYNHEQLAKKTVELSFQEESLKTEKQNLEMNLDAVLSDLSPSVTILLKSCAKLTAFEGPLRQIDFDSCIDNMEKEIDELEKKLQVSGEVDKSQNIELKSLWTSLLELQLIGAEDAWAEQLMDSASSAGEKSSFRDQFREMMEQAVRRANESEKLFNQSVVAWERKFQSALNSTTQRVEESLRSANREYYVRRENEYNSHAQGLRKEESMWLQEMKMVFYERNVYYDDPIYRYMYYV